MRSAGFARPRIAVAGLNPHAGDGGNFGREEIDVIAPVVEAGKQELMRAVQLRPRFTQARVNLGKLLKDEGKPAGTAGGMRDSSEGRLRSIGPGGRPNKRQS